MASIWGDWSVATTCPAGPARWAAVTAGSPMPVPTSSTRCPGRIFAKSTRRSLTCCNACSKLGHHFFQPGATCSHSWRCPTLYCTGSKDCVLIATLRLDSATLTLSILRQWLRKLDLVASRIHNPKVSGSPGLTNDPLRHMGASALELGVKLFKPMRKYVKGCT